MAYMAHFIRGCETCITFKQTENLGYLKLKYGEVFVVLIMKKKRESSEVGRIKNSMWHGWRGVCTTSFIKEPRSLIKWDR